MQNTKILEILKYVQNNRSHLSYEEDIFNILEGDVLTYLYQALLTQFNRKAAEEALQRACPINILRKITDKLSKLYANQVVRIANNPNNQELVDYYSPDEYFAEANFAFNGFKRAGIEIYYNENEREIEFRTIPTHLYLPYSDDAVNPTKMNYFIKMFADKFYIYNDEEFVIVDKDGKLVANDANGVNEYGVIPFAYIGRSKYKLLPISDTDLKQMSILFPVLLSDLNFSMKYMTCPIIYGIDLSEGELSRNPNVFWSFKSTDDGKTPSIGSITPQADLSGILNNIKEQMSFWLETKNIKANAIGINSGDQAASGLALMLRNIDTTEDRKQQMAYFRELEEDFWYKLSKIHNHLASIGAIDNRNLFTDDFEVTVKYAEQKPIEDRTELVNRLKLESDAGFISRRMAIKELNPDFNNDDVDKLIKEIDDEMIERPDQYSKSSSSDENKGTMEDMESMQDMESEQDIVE